MREILFRGKRIDNGEWVEGYFFKTPLTDEATGSEPNEGWFFLTGKPRYCISTVDSGCVFEIDPATVGQYTGLKDNNGNKIFEGDILQWDDEENFHSVMKYGEMKADEEESYFGWHIECIENGCGGVFIIDDLNYMQVIGNIHDNPELMGGNT